MHLLRTNCRAAPHESKVSASVFCCVAVNVLLEDDGTLQNCVNLVFHDHFKLTKVGTCYVILESWKTDIYNAHM